jgi:hypothetical protein
VDNDELLEMSLEDLYLELGRLLFPSESFGGDDWRLVAGQAKDWINDNKEALRLKVCPNVENADTVIELSTIADALGGYLHGPACFVVAAIILKFGIVAFCRDFRAV